MLNMQDISSNDYGIIINNDSTIIEEIFNGDTEFAEVMSMEREPNYQVVFANTF